MDNINSFEDLEVWKLCRELKYKLIGIAIKLPKEERYRMADQIIRASRSITNNIAEGYGRFHFKENIQFCRISRGSIYECIDHLYCCLDENLIESSIFENLKIECTRCLQILNGYIRYLNKVRDE